MDGSDGKGVGCLEGTGCMGRGLGGSVPVRAGRESRTRGCAAVGVERCGAGMDLGNGIGVRVGVIEEGGRARGQVGDRVAVCRVVVVVGVGIGVEMEWLSRNKVRERVIVGWAIRCVQF